MGWPWTETIAIRLSAVGGGLRTHHNANTHWAFPTSRETDQAIADARLAFADFLNASPEEVAFGANMTTLTFHLARSLGRGCGAGDEIVVTELDQGGFPKRVTPRSSHSALRIEVAALAA